MQDGEKQGDAKKLTGVAVTLTDLLDYQDDAVVSRTIIDKATGTCTLFAFDDGQGLSEHTAPFIALLVYCLSGACATSLESSVLVALSVSHYR